VPSREVLLAETFVQLADTLVDDFDIVELLTVLADRCVELLDAAAAGILLVDQRGALQVVAASTEQARLLELFQLQNHEGPCLDCFSSGRAVVNQTLADANPWRRFAPEALAAGFQSVQALPLRLRDTVIGALNVFMAGSVAASDADLAVAQALADVATIALLQNQTARHSQVVNSQLQSALNSRIVIEQAKGVLAGRAQIDMDEAFSRLRGYARSRNRQLAAVASDLVEGKLSAEALTRLTPPR
jgi:transcriptional regulator with GAF, ATPase, and Fis domain